MVDYKKKYHKYKFKYLNAKKLMYGRGSSGSRSLDSDDEPEEPEEDYFNNGDYLNNDNDNDNDDDNNDENLLPVRPPSPPPPLSDSINARLHFPDPIIAERVDSGQKIYEPKRSPVNKTEANPSDNLPSAPRMPDQFLPNAPPKSPRT